MDINDIAKMMNEQFQKIYENLEKIEHKYEQKLDQFESRLAVLKNEIEHKYEQKLDQFESRLAVLKNENEQWTSKWLKREEEFSSKLQENQKIIDEINENLSK